MTAVAQVVTMLGLLYGTLVLGGLAWLAIMLWLGGSDRERAGYE